MDKVNVSKQDVRLFNTIAIETSSMCNRKCFFCPNHHNARPDEEMPWPLLEKIIEELAAIKYKGRITTYIYNEPLRDKRALEIIRYISRMLPRCCIMLSTNCDYIKSRDQIAAIYDAGARQVIFNIYSASDHLTGKRFDDGVAKAKARGDQIQQWIDELGLEQKKGMYDFAPRGARRGRVERKYGIKPGDNKLGQFELQNRSGKIGWFTEGLAEPLRKMCVRPFRMFNINWKGDALLCCNDYDGDLELGNVNDSTLLELWNSDAMNRYRLSLNRRNRNVKLCAQCDYGGGAYTHLVDDVTFGSKAKDEAALQIVQGDFYGKA